MINFALSACPGPKLTLGRTSEMTPEGWCTVFSAGLGFLGGQYGTPFSPEIPKIAKKCLKQGPPPLLTNFSGSLQKCTPHFRRFLEKSAEIPPAGPSAMGKHRTFFRKIGEYEGVDFCKLPRIVFFRGGLKPCSMAGTLLLGNVPSCGMGTPILGTFWRFWGFTVKTVCQTGLPEEASQQRKHYTTRRGSSQRPSRGCTWAPDTHGVRNTPCGGPLR